MNADLAGPAALTGRAEPNVAGDGPLEVLHLVDIALSVDPSDKTARAIRTSALEKLAATSGGKTLGETMWLKAEIADADATLAAG